MSRTSDQPPPPATPAGVATATPSPIGLGERFVALDAVRGFALLGILGPNIIVFGWPHAAMLDTSVMGGGWWNELGLGVTSLFFQGKMMALFSMLFGAGAVVYGRKFDSQPGSAGKGRPLSRGAGLWYIRMAWLFAFGLAHAIFLWYGDILVWYALTGFGLVWWVRRLEAGPLLAIGMVLYLLGTALFAGVMALGVVYAAGSAGGLEALGGDPAAETAAYLGGYLDAMRARLVELVFTWLVIMPLFVPTITGLMIMGMALLKMRVFSGERSTGFYAKLAGLSLAVGAVTTGGGYVIAIGAGGEYGHFIWQIISQLLGLPLSLGYACAVVWVVKSGRIAWLSASLAAVGRMAFSNYFLQTILCTTLFYGYGLGGFTRIDYPGLFAVMAAVWAVNIGFSLLWLRVFRFGPAEWLWRCLTYRQRFPIRRRSPAVTIP